MTIHDFTNLFLADPTGSAKTGLRFVHFIGLALGLGGATLLDLLMLRFFVRRRVSEDNYVTFAFASKIIDIGLKILWITGLGFLFHYALFDLAKLSNPKIYAKLSVVLILTANGVLIHNLVLPMMKAQVGRPIFSGMSWLKRSLLITSGAVSVVSWYSPVALGAFSQLNFAVPASTLLSIYMGLVLITALAMHAVILLLMRGADVPAAEQGRQGRDANALSRRMAARPALSLASGQSMGRRSLNAVPAAP